MQIPVPTSIVAAAPSLPAMATQSSQDDDPEADRPPPPPLRFGEKPRPRTLLHLSEESVARELQDLFRHTTRVDRPDDVNQGNYELVITDRWLSNGDIGQFGTHLYAIVFAPMDEIDPVNLGPAVSDDDYRVNAYWLADRALDEVVEIPSNLNARFTKLAKRDLVPQALDRDTHPLIIGTRGSTTKSIVTIPLLRTEVDQHDVAGFITRQKSPGRVALVLPGDVKRHTEWVLAAISLFRAVHPDLFIHLPGWDRNRQWLTPDELDVQVRIEQLEEELDATVRTLGQELERQRALLDRRRHQAESGRRRLLKATGDELVDEVTDLLKDLGYRVIDVDRHRSEGEPRREDLRVTDPTDGWTALVEVKGRTRGAAKTTELQRFPEWRELFRDESGRNPDASWYIVNQYANQDPAVRPPILETDPDALALFARSDGLAIDTSTLFRLWNLVATGEMMPDAARDLLRDTRGRFADQDLLKAVEMRDGDD